MLGTTQSQSAIQIARSIIISILHLQLLLALPLITIAPFYTDILIEILAGRRWANTQVPITLAFYCLYLPFMGINGILESFVAGVAGQRGVSGWIQWLCGFWIIYAVIAIALMGYAHLGGIGLVLANCLNMAMRIWFSYRFTNDWFRSSSTSPSSSSSSSSNQENQLKDNRIRIIDFMPKILTIFIWIIGGICIALGRPWFQNAFVNSINTNSSGSLNRMTLFRIIFGGIITLICLFFTFHLEKEFFKTMLIQWKIMKSNNSNKIKSDGKFE